MDSVAKALAEGRVRLTPGSGRDLAVVTAAEGTQVLGHNSRRVALVLVNNSANRAHFARRPGIVSDTTGVPIDASGGIIAQRYEIVGRACQLEVWAKFETANGNLYVEEYEAET